MDVTVVGSCNVDLVSYVPQLPKAGETILGYKFVQGYGGKGANPCVMAARLGAKTAIVSKVGDDTYGDGYLASLKKDSIDISHVAVTKEEASGMAFIFVDDQGENSIVVVAGANNLISEKDVLSAESLIQSSKLLMCCNEIEPAATLQALKLAKKHKVRSLFNFAPAQRNLAEDFLNVCSILVVNESEAEILTSLPVKTLEETQKAISKLLTYGCETVIITLGEQGAMFATKEMPKAVHVQGQKVKPVDTTGAGDAFCGSLGFFLSTMPDLPLDESIRRACVVASISVQSPGTQTSYQPRHQLPQELFTGM